MARHRYGRQERVGEDAQAGPGADGAWVGGCDEAFGIADVVIRKVAEVFRAVRFESVLPRPEEGLRDRGCGRAGYSTHLVGEKRTGPNTPPSSRMLLRTRLRLYYFVQGGENGGVGDNLSWNQKRWCYSVTLRPSPGYALTVVTVSSNVLGGTEMASVMTCRDAASAVRWGGKIAIEMRER